MVHDLSVSISDSTFHHITRAHGFPRKILQNSTAYHGKIIQIFLSHHGVLFVSELSSILFTKTLVSEGLAGIVALC